MRQPFSMEVGRVVKSLAGRDSGRLMMIVRVESDDYVYVADGGLRKVDSPKKKKVKHLTPTKELFTTLSVKLTEGKKIFDSEVRKALEALSEQQEG